MIEILFITNFVYTANNFKYEGFEDLLNPDKKNIEMFCSIGFHIIQLGGHKNAIPYFDRVLKMEPDNEVAKNGLKCINYLKNKENF